MSILEQITGTISSKYATRQCRGQFQLSLNIMIKSLHLIQSKLNLFWPSIPNLVLVCPARKCGAWQWATPGGQITRGSRNKFRRPQRFQVMCSVMEEFFWSFHSKWHPATKLVASYELVPPKPEHNPASTLPAGYGTLQARLWRAWLEGKKGGGREGHQNRWNLSRKGWEENWEKGA